jgi:hypothetical protein
MTNNLLPGNISIIRKFYEEAFQFYDHKRELPEIAVEFYPYVGINQTIRVREGKVFVRLAELCRDAPPAFQRALAFILTAKLLRKKVSPNASEVYRSYIKSCEVQTKARENKREKGRKVISSAAGEIYNLEEIFVRINSLYFRNSIPTPTLTWSARQTYRILGHHDATHETIVISKSLDDIKVPLYVVEFVVFHEMLHIFHPTERRDGRNYNHTPQFRRNEKKFTHFEQAEKWIEQNARRLKVKSKKANGKGKR